MVTVMATKPLFGKAAQLSGRLYSQANLRRFEVTVTQRAKDKLCNPATKGHHSQTVTE